MKYLWDRSSYYQRHTERKAKCQLKKLRVYRGISYKRKPFTRRIILKKSKNTSLHLMSSRSLTQCVLVTPHGLWFRQYPVIPSHDLNQYDLSSVKSSYFHRRTILHGKPRQYITEICLKITLFKFHWNLPESELNNNTCNWNPSSCRRRYIPRSLSWLC